MSVEHRDRSLGVFICSTKADLRKQRDAIIKVVQNLRQNQISMEVFGAHVNEPIDVCLEEVARCDLMVVVAAYRYGSIAEGRDVSFSEAEYQHGRSLAKPCLVYMPDKDVPVQPKHFESDPMKLAKLLRWKAELETRHTVAYYRSTIDLVSHIAVDLPKAKHAILEGTLTASGKEQPKPDDSRYLATEQNENLRVVWVFAPHPLETLPDGFHTEIRAQVAKNLVAGVKYVYFVESDSGIERIAQLVDRLAVSAAIPYREAIQIMKKQVEICVLDSPSFLTHFTIHVCTDDDIAVFQSVVLPDRADQITKLPAPRAREVYEKIGELLVNTVELESKGFMVRKKVT